MSIITVTTPFNIDLEFRTSPFSKRLMAWIIDILAISVYYYIMLDLIFPLIGKSESITTATELFVVILPVLAYQLAFEVLYNGQTLGKMAAGIKVIDKDGQEPTMGQYIIRWMLCLGNLFVYIIPYILLKSPLMMIGFLVLYIPDFLSVIISPKALRLGDIAAGTVVIDKNYKADITQTIYLAIEEQEYVPQFPEVMRLTDRDINGIRNLLEVKKSSKDMGNYMLEVERKIKKLLGVESELPVQEFLQQLLKDYNYFSSK